MKVISEKLRVKQQHKIIPAAIRGRYAGGGIVQKLELRPDYCTNTLTSVQKDNVLVICQFETKDEGETNGK